MTTIRVVAADDSRVMRQMLTALFDASDAMDLCGLANDGVRCLEIVRAMLPDVVLLDLEMPGMDGMAVLDVLHREFPDMPIVMCSSYTAWGAAITLEALARGAADYVTKPAGDGMGSLAAELLPKIVALVEKARRGVQAVSSMLRPVMVPGRVEIVGIGASTGGPAALGILLPKLPVGLMVPVVVVQHMPPLFLRELVGRLDRMCALPVRLATHGTLMTPGVIWFAPTEVDWERCGAALIAVEREPLAHHGRAAVDCLFRSMAKAYGGRAMGLVLSGMGSDGLAGAHAMVHAGGAVLAQDEASCAVWGMPGRVVQAGLAAGVMSASALAAEVVARVQVGVAETVVWNEVAYAA